VRTNIGDWRVLIGQGESGEVVKRDNHARRIEAQYYLHVTSSNVAWTGTAERRIEGCLRVEGL
jgi:hypothetical protein